MTKNIDGLLGVAAAHGIDLERELEKILRDEIDKESEAEKVKNPADLNCITNESSSLIRFVNDTIQPAYKVKVNIEMGHGAYYTPYIPDLPNHPKFSDEVSEEQTKTKHERVWITGDGTRIPISEMTEEHAKNALGMIMELASEGHYWKMNDEGKLVWKHSNREKSFTSEFPCDIITPWIQPLQESVKEDLTENTSSINSLSSKLMRPTSESPSVQAALSKSPLRKDGTVMFTEPSSKIVNGIYALQSSLTGPMHLNEK